MPKVIVWSAKAAFDYEQIIDFLLNKWNPIIANNFIETIDFTIDLISQNPLLFPEINPQKKIHKCVLNKHNSLVYKNNDASIEIVRILIHKMKPIEF